MPRLQTSLKHQVRGHAGGARDEDDDDDEGPVYHAVGEPVPGADDGLRSHFPMSFGEGVGPQPGGSQDDAGPHGGTACGCRHPRRGLCRPWGLCNQERDVVERVSSCRRVAGTSKAESLAAAHASVAAALAEPAAPAAVPADDELPDIGPSRPAPGDDEDSDGADDEEDDDGMDEDAAQIPLSHELLLQGVSA